MGIFASNGDQSRVSDPKFEDRGCWAKTPEVSFLG